MSCQKCGRYVLLARSQLARRLKKVLHSEELQQEDQSL
ncbi:uncharacterized protein METZ01_LOCUS69201 [marine metagenome]|uniref:Uncharacterized protein n=1 Tax=marine metagenome TaxID=408172 RepID=A0A381TNI7_9ZZZZ